MGDVSGDCKSTISTSSSLPEKVAQGGLVSGRALRRVAVCESPGCQPARACSMWSSRSDCTNLSWSRRVLRVGCSGCGPSAGRGVEPGAADSELLADVAGFEQRRVHEGAPGPYIEGGTTSSTTEVSVVARRGGGTLGVAGATLACLVVVSYETYPPVRRGVAGGTRIGATLRFVVSIALDKQPFESSTGRAILLRPSECADDLSLLQARPSGQKPDDLRSASSSLGVLPRDAVDLVRAEFGFAHPLDLSHAEFRVLHESQCETRRDRSEVACQRRLGSRSVGLPGRGP